MMLRLAPVLLAILVGCPKPPLTIPATPRTPALPDLPAPPRPQAVTGAPSASIEGFVEGIATGHRTRPDPRLVILPLWQPPLTAVQRTPVDLLLGELGMPDLSAAGTPVVQASNADAALALIEREAEAVLVRAGFTYTIPADRLRGVAATKEVERDGVVRWIAPLSDLAEVEPVTGADVLIRLGPPTWSEVASEQRTDQVIAQEALEAYRREYDAWRAAALEVLAARERAQESYDRACRAELRAYQSAGGRFEGERYAAEAAKRAECARGITDLRRAVEQAESRIAAAIPPDRVGVGRGPQTEVRRDRLEQARVPARIADGHTLGVMWLGDLVGVAPTREAALDLALAQLPSVIPVAAPSAP